VGGYSALFYAPCAPEERQLMDKRHAHPTDLATWPTRDAMVDHGLAINLPWLAFVNISFALMILLRNVLLDDFDAIYHVTQPLNVMLNGFLLGIIALSVALIFMGWRHVRGIDLALCLTSVMWSGASYALLTVWQLPHAWPLCAILLLSALAALYYHPTGLLAFVLPLWLALPVASVVLNQGINLRFAVVWTVFSLILLCGRFILVSWFNEAWRRNQQNQLLIARLDALAHKDPLTDTANRRSMENVLENAVNQGHSFTVIMLDVDYFKLYNDHYGHQAGDACLTRVAKALSHSVRTPDDVVSRYGGEEFVVILFDCSKEMAEQVAKRIQDNLRAEAIPHAQSKVSEWVTVSMGIASMQKGHQASEIIAQADAALYRAKNAGRDRWSA
jgi:diguanylate cyclase (GGDEF)-like protein